MERLTKRGKEGVAYWNGANGVHYSDNQGNIYGNAITKLAEYEDADEQGLLIRLPVPISMFLSEVDKEKYPDVKQEYRFEELANQIGGAI